MSQDVGVHVFPSRVSERIRQSDALIHYSFTRPIIPDDPPVDYEIDNLESGAYTRISYIPKQTPPTRGKNAALAIPRLADPPAKTTPSPRARQNRISATDTVNESRLVLDDLDQVLEQDEQMSFEEIRKKIKDMNLSFRQYAPMPTFDEPPIDYINSPSDAVEPRPHADYMDGEKSSKYPSNVSAPTLNKEVIIDLKKMPDGISSLAAVQKEHRRNAEDMEKRMWDEIADIKRRYTAEYFFEQTPTHFKRNPNLEIPRWKRMLMAQKIAQQAIAEQEESIRGEYDRWRQQYAPRWRSGSSKSSLE